MWFCNRKQKDGEDPHIHMLVLFNTPDKCLDTLMFALGLFGSVQWTFHLPVDFTISCLNANVCKVSQFAENATHTDRTKKETDNKR